MFKHFLFYVFFQFLVKLGMFVIVYGIKQLVQSLLVIWVRFVLFLDLICMFLVQRFSCWNYKRASYVFCIARYVAQHYTRFHVHIQSCHATHSAIRNDISNCVPDLIYRAPLCSPILWLDSQLGEDLRYHAQYLILFFYDLDGLIEHFFVIC